MILPRYHWTHDPAPGHVLTGPLGLVIIHHTYRPDVRPDASPEEEVRAIRGVDRFHIEQDWGGAGYSFGVFQSGRAYELRGWLRSGAHTKGQNSKGHAICLFMDGSVHDPTPAAIDAVRLVIADGIRKGAVTPAFHVKPHDAFTVKVCPGARIKAILPLLRPSGNRHDLVMGDRGIDVQQLQEQLKALGFLKIDRTTTYFGPLTRDALRAFQKASGLHVDGVAGPLTRAALDEKTA